MPVDDLDAAKKNRERIAALQAAERRTAQLDRWQTPNFNSVNPVRYTQPKPPVTPVIWNTTDFERDYPTDDACLEWLFKERYPQGVTCPKCGKVTKHYRIQGRPCYSCEVCGNHVYPMAGTIFDYAKFNHLKLWFKAVFNLSKKPTISSRRLSRDLGVTVKAGYRMWKVIKSLPAHNSILLFGIPIMPHSIKQDRRGVVHPVHYNKVKQVLSQVDKALASGASIRQCSRELGVAINTVREHVKETGTDVSKQVTEPHWLLFALKGLALTIEDTPIEEVYNKSMALLDKFLKGNATRTILELMPEAEHGVTFTADDLIRKTMEFVTKAYLDYHSDQWENIGNGEYKLREHAPQKTEA